MSFRTKITLEDGEAYVIAPMEFWEHVIKTYKTLAEDQEGKDYWLDAADFIYRWMLDTMYVDGSATVDDEGWN